MSKQEEGGIDVNSNLTPITKQTVPEVTGLDWNKMSIPELYDQLSILQTRYYYMLQQGKSHIADQIHAGIVQLETLITIRQTEEMQRGNYNVR